MRTKKFLQIYLEEVLQFKVPPQNPTFSQLSTIQVVTEYNLNDQPTERIMTKKSLL